MNHVSLKPILVSHLYKLHIGPLLASKFLGNHKSCLQVLILTQT